ncbi:AlpA family transcriptional regulator [Pantoea sp. SOD02]|uniref:helix-turn-helix transcriptional regulator n=1 Tax=Pantoea sp. SOD02 TaxID=2970818 RepID=UPI0021570695|nr:AlpA family phage regulatory protein [Pantoea sp. SOD02]UVC29310.1 AlpA family phage regulatory protein [Pantoea sp. SOD02]
MNHQEHSDSGLPTTGFIRRHRLAQLLGVHVSTIDRKVKNGTLPRPIKLSDKVTAFDAAELHRWLEDRIAISNGGDHD